VPDDGEAGRSHPALARLTSGVWRRNQLLNHHHFVSHTVGSVPFRCGSRQRELLLVVLDHLLALCLRQVIRVADRVYTAAASPMKLIFPSAGPTDRC
jgi:hypothetical protein